MEKNDVQLIRRILLGDEEAFTLLVEKHQKGVHRTRVAKNRRLPHR